MGSKISRLARFSVMLFVVLAGVACGPAISDGPSPHGITDDELRSWVANAATLSQVEKSLGGRKPYSEHEAGSQSWALIAKYAETEPGLRDRSSLKNAVEKYPKVLLHATRSETTWIFFDAAGVAREFYRTPNPVQSPLPAGARGRE